MTIRRAIAVGVMVSGLAVGQAAVASAGVSNPGTPGAPNCKGQTTAWATQGNFAGVRGVGNIVKETGIPHDDLRDLRDTFCAAP